MRSIRIVAALMTSACVMNAALAAHVIDPKASYVDVNMRRHDLKKTHDPRVLKAIAELPSCVKLPFVPAPVGRMNIPWHYINGSHGAVNPRELEATRQYLAFEKRVTAGMNQWLAHGNEDEAKCSVEQMDAWAKADALIDYDPKESSQSWYQAGWTLSSIAITESVLINDNKIDKVTHARLIAWMNKAAHKLVDFDKKSKQRNNLHYWRGLAATAVGVISSDDELFTYGVNTFKEAVGEIDQRGAFPQEMKRNERAIHYQSFALQPLIPIANFAERQEVYLYDYSSLTNRRMEDAIIFLGDAMANPGIVKSYIADKQMTDFDAPDFLAAVELTLHHFPLKRLPKAIQEGLKKPAYATRIGGSMTVVAEREIDLKPKR